MVRPKYPILDLIEERVISGEEKVLKPNAEIYEILLRRFNIKPEESVFIDDNVNNIKGGENVGIQGVIFKDAEQLRTDLEKLL